MLKSFSSVHGIITAVLFCLCVFVGLAGAQVPWRPVSQAELDMKTPKVEPDADAEAIFWDVQLDDEKRSKLFYNHYVRVKIFTERGREKFAKFDIPFSKDKKVEEVAARVIKPDGTIVVLQPSDIFERDILRAGKTLWRAKSFAVPGIEPGVIVEYQYKETFKGDSLDNERLYFQREIPLQSATYRVRPYKTSVLNFSFQNMPQMRFIRNEDGFYVGTRENVPAFREEPQMPPENEVREWVLLKYESFYGFQWSLYGNALSMGFDKETKLDDDIRRKAQELTAGASTPEERIRRLFDFAQQKIRNVDFDASLTDEQREKLNSKNASETLKRGAGTSNDIGNLFGALAKAAGFDVNKMYSGNRNVKFFNHQTDNGINNIHASGIAVRVGNEWFPYDPGTPFMPMGFTFPHDELISTMIVGGGGYNWIRLPLADYKRNLSKRTGKFKLLEDGTLEGFVRVEHNGHQATTRREDLFMKTPAERDEIVSKYWKETLSSADLTGFSIENFSDSSKPYIYSFNVRVPGYAQKTGKRLFLQPGFFKFKSGPLFSSDSRRYNIYFEYPYSELDEIEIEIPKNYEPEGVDSPGAVNEAKGLAADSVTMEFSKETNTLKYKRDFFFGGNGKIIFPATAYKPLKLLFDSFHKIDTHSVSLRQKQ